MNDRFNLHVPAFFFEKAGPDGKMQRHVAGLVSTESVDRQGETILQRGIDWSDCLEWGWINIEHSKDIDKKIGYPEEIKFVRKGDKLPDGTAAPNHGHWMEGQLISGYGPAEGVWELAKALERSKSKRRLGFSVEGVIVKRTGPDNKTIAKAKVQHIACTASPVNQDTGLVALEKALSDAEHEEVATEDLDLDSSEGKEHSAKALMMGPVSSNTKPTTGGRVLSPQSLEHDEPKPDRRLMSKSEAISFAQTRYNLKKTTAERIVDLIPSLRACGYLG